MGWAGVPCVRGGWCTWRCVCVCVGGGGGGNGGHWRGWSGRQKAKRLDLSLRTWLCTAPHQQQGTNTNRQRGELNKRHQQGPPETGRRHDALFLPGQARAKGNEREKAPRNMPNRMRLGRAVHICLPALQLSPKSAPRSQLRNGSKRPDWRSATKSSS
ncbi:hypothetical protein CKAH01_08573 [Colletotrichum kahawae]|uniref:Uncharacterized protein n=1 Tax=Colletotrichum kahawae TaxID=34407 RepID=A0AAD9Y0Y5_COLKA|nr:hypothetical protein CKAH01_08573 [Colletotrichum kahawae]